MKVQVLGAGLDVGRSCLLLTIADRHILLDCGAHHGFADNRRFPDFSSLPADILSNIECILVTHFHFDHAAALPYLACTHDCRAPIYMTEPTLHLTSLMLQDFLSTSATRHHACPFTDIDVHTMLTRVKPLTLEHPTTILPSTATATKKDGNGQKHSDNSVVVTAFPAGHTLGAVMLHVRAGGHSLLYSGDYSLRPDRVLPTAALPPSLSPHLFVTEATYCSSSRSPTDDTDADMVAAVLRALSRRGKVLFPVSAFGRVHALCASLSRLAPQFPLHEVPAYVVSGTTTKALDIYNRFSADWTVQSSRENVRCIHCRTSESVVTTASNCTSPLPPSNSNSMSSSGSASASPINNDKSNDIKSSTVDDANNNNISNNATNADGDNNINTTPTNDKKRKRSQSRFTTARCAHGLLDNLRPFNRTHDWHVIDAPGPVMLFATPANLSMGISRQVFQAWCTHPDNLVVMPSASFATSVASNVFSSSSASAAQNAATSGQQVRCKIVNSSSACHPDSSDILRICRHIDPKSVMLVHGEQNKVLAFRQRIENVLGVPCYAPANGDTVQIPDDILSAPASAHEAEKAFQLPKALAELMKQKTESVMASATF